MDLLADTSRGGPLPTRPVPNRARPIDEGQDFAFASVRGTPMSRLLNMCIHSNPAATPKDLPCLD